MSHLSSSKGDLSQQVQWVWHRGMWGKKEVGQVIGDELYKLMKWEIQQQIGKQDGLLVLRFI